MRTTRFVSVSAAVVALGALGCASLPGFGPEPDAPTVTKRFFGGSIVYTVDLEAQHLLRKMVELQGQVASLSEGKSDPRADHLILPIYRDADLDRDHHVSHREAEAFYHQYVRQFEDHLGPVVYR